MAAPTYGSTGTYTSGSANTVGVNVPPGSVDDIIVVTLYKENTDAVGTLPSGFAEDVNSPNSTAAPQNIRTHMFWKRAVSGDNAGGTYTFGWTNSTYRAATATRYPGVIATGNPWDVTAVTATSSSATGAPAITLITTGPDRLLVYMSSSFNSGAWTPPTGFAERVDQGDITVDDLAQATAGSSGSLQATQSNSTHVAWAGALIPAGGGGPIVPVSQYGGRW